MFGDMIEPQFHPGERAAQTQAGVAPRGSAIRNRMPDQHRVFFAALSFVVVATNDDAGWPLGAILTGPPGFVASPDAETLWIAAVPDRDDPATAWLKPGAPIGVLGIDLATRRRNRANGWIANVAAGRLTVAVKESFGNCPQYIHIRDIESGHAAPHDVETLDLLDEPARRAIATADTLFVATASGHGVDISHRGGKPGFVQIAGDALTVPDYAGNRYFNTLGNMLLDPRAALLFPDFANGDLLLVQGQTEILWDVPETERLPGAERLWRLHVTRAWRRRGALPLRWTLRAMSPSFAQNVAPEVVTSA
jgi:predicted pyridoxine 5'-phosphate oxidase superfamily flavin-nucleotide-binding protein